MSSRRYIGILCLCLIVDLAGATEVTLITQAAASKGDEAKAQVSAADLPEDSIQTLVTTFKPNFILDKSLLVALSYNLHRGDRFAHTQGAELSGEYFIRPNLGLLAGANFYSVSLENQAREVFDSKGDRPIVYDPKYGIYAGVGYYPIYGKLRFGSAVRNFYLGGIGTINSLNLQRIDSAGGSSAQSFGLSIGLVGLFHLSTSYFLKMGARSIWYGKKFEPGSGTRQGYELSAGVGCQW